MFVLVDGVLDRTPGRAVTLAHELEHGDGGNEARRDQLLERTAVAETQRLDVEALGLQRAEQLLDEPALAIERDDPARIGGIGDFVAGQQAPVSNWHARWGVHFQGLHQGERHRGRQGLKFGMALAADRAGDLDAAKAQGEDRRAGSTAGSGRQIDAHARGFGKAGGALEQARAVSEHAVLAGADQDLDARRLAGEILVDVAFTISDDGDAGRPRRHQIGGAFGAVEPAPAFLLGEGLVFVLPPLATGAHEKTGIDQSQERTFDRIDRDHRMQRNAASFGFGANRRGVLDGQHMAARQRARRCAPLRSRSSPRRSPPDCAKTA